MKIVGPERYKLTFDSQRFASVCEKGTSNFSGIATKKFPKLYIASSGEEPIYVGVTRQPIRNRLRLGWNSKGETGYYGYAWRHEFSELDLNIWMQTDAPPESSNIDMETVEAEVVHLIRCSGQWPRYQTEIHFHPSNDEHRTVAAAIYGHYKR
jgi:hypothetical protein